ncbi:MAG TPA: PA14 domain-containing protein, partial [Candidatus Goldiibacteriota bacterium]|nr:PA14 domain-containing protein [Candidatus Goldiibacteriota bacterium]
GIYFLVMGIKRGEPVFYVLSGLMAAFSMYTYAPGRMVIPAVFLIFVMLVVDTKKIKDTLSNFNGLFLFSAAAIIAAVPVIYYMTSAGSGYFSRAEYYSLKGLNLHEQYISQLITYIFSFFTSGSVMAAENLPARPLLHGLEAVLFLAGFAYVLAFFRKKENAVLLIWFFVSLIPGMFFASSARPSFFRIITALPCIAIFIGIGAYCIYNLISAVFVKNSGRIFWGIFITVFAYTSIITYNDYFFRYPADGKVLEYFENAGAEVESMAVKNTARGKDVFVSAYYNQLNRGFCSFCREKNKLKIVNPGELALSAFYGNKDTVIITEGIYADALKILGEYFPDIKITAVKNSGSSEIWIDPAAKDYKYVKAEIPKKNIDVLYGLKAEYYSGRNSVKSDIFKGAINPDGTFDSVILSGLIEMPDYASVKIDFENAAYSLEIDGNKYDGSRLYRGLHTFTARIEPKSSGLISSYWQLENGKRTSIPVSCMINSGRFFGLIAKYAYNFNDQSAYQLEPQINTRFYNSSKPAIIKDKLTNEFFSINWKGYFNAENDGNYMFELKTADHFCNAIWLNGTLVYSRFGQEAEYGAVNLKKGWNKIEIISYSQAYDSLDTVYILKAKKYEEKEYTAVKYTELKPFLE